MGAASYEEPTTPVAPTVPRPVLTVEEAAKALYQAAHWTTSSLSPEAQEALWLDLKIALKLPDGTSPKP